MDPLLLRGWLAAVLGTVAMTLSSTTEMYLRTIYELEEEGIVPLRARIAERLHQSGPTVSQTVARMERDNLVHVLGDRHLELTDEGRSRGFARITLSRQGACSEAVGTTDVVVKIGSVVVADKQPGLGEVTDVVRESLAPCGAKVVVLRATVPYFVDVAVEVPPVAPGGGSTPVAGGAPGSADGNELAVVEIGAERTEVSLERIVGNVTVRTTHGDVLASDIAGAVDIEAEHSDVTVMRAASLTVVTSFDDVAASDHVAAREEGDVLAHRQIRVNAR